MILALLLSCRPDAPPDPAVADAQAYLAATAAADPQQAIASCQTIASRPLRGECLLYAATSLAETGRAGEALALCRGIEDLAWRQVCGFEIVDSQALTGEQAVAGCQGTGHFQERCLSHALSREESAIAARFPAGQEAEMIAYIEQRLRDYGLEGVSREGHVEKMTSRILAQRMMPRLAAGAVVSLAMCGAAPQAACAEAYREVVQKVDRQGRSAQACAIGADAARIQALGLPGWSEDFQPVAELAWPRLCAGSAPRPRQP